MQEKKIIKLLYRVVLYLVFLKYIDFHKVKDIANEIIWNNSHIKSQNEMLFYKKWQTAGITKVKQIINDGNWVNPVQLNSYIG